MKYKTIYILTPDHTEAGGIESIYQLADAINEQGGSAINIFNNKEDNPIPKRYLHYNLKYSDKFEDSSENIFIVPEIWTPKLAMTSNCQKAIWWLSVDHNYNQFHDFYNKDILHFCQSYYAVSYLQSKGNHDALLLNDWVPYTDYISSLKENIVCFNPAKGKEITEKILKLNTDVEFVPLVNLSPEEVQSLLLKSKVYIDFGNHPGRDRIPREAAMLGNCVLTNRAGSAKFYSDLSIEYNYKHDTIENVGQVIKDCFDNYEVRIKDFDLYRNIISKQKEELYLRVRQLFLG